MTYTIMASVKYNFPLLPGMERSNYGINLITGETTFPLIQMTKGNKVLRDNIRGNRKNNKKKKLKTICKRKDMEYL